MAIILEIYQKYIKSYMSDSIHQPLNKSIKESLDPSHHTNSLDPSRSTVNEEVLTESMLTVDNEQNKKEIKKYKVICGVGICFLILGLIMFLLLPPLIHSQVVQGAIDQAVLSEDNQDFWAHFPGESKTIITRNFSFFNLLNEEGMLLHGQIPKFQQIQGYVIQELEDYLNISYSKDKAFVTMKDWLHFQEFPGSKSLDQKVKPINAPSLGYWYTLKNSKDSLVFLQGFSLLFNNIQDSIIQTVLGQGIAAQYLLDFQTAYLEMLQPAGISMENSHFIWNDQAYGMGDKDNLKYWVMATKTSFSINSPSFSSDALNLKDYFTLSDRQMTYILGVFKEYVESLEELIFENHYCLNVTGVECDGRELAIRQMAESYITQNTPPVSSIIPTDTICRDNVTCNGFYPELSSYYTNVYLKQHPESDPFLKFQVDMVRKWLDYNPQRIQGVYNKAESALLHIGNLDALFNNGSCYDNTDLQEEDRNACLSNILKRFELPTANHAKVFWGWIKYLINNLLRQETQGNEYLGVGLTFSTGLYSSFAFLQDNLQKTLLTVMIRKKLSQGTCQDFVKKSLETDDTEIVTNICNHYGSNIASEQFVSMGIGLCRNKFGDQWKHIKNLGATPIQVESFCDSQNTGGFGQVYDSMRIQINDYYNCDQTPNRYCSDYELALKQWANSSVTKSQPPTAGAMNISTTFADWNSQAQPFEYYHYTQKFTDKKFPIYDAQSAYMLFTFDKFFSAPYIISIFKDHEVLEVVKDYMRYVSIFIGLRGFTHARTVRELIFGYNDEYLLEIKNAYPPFGGDPSTPAYVAFNDLNVSQEDVTLELEWYTGKNDSKMASQYRKINGLPYLTTNYSRFNGNETYWVLQTPWEENDYFYGTSGKQFSPDQPNSKNISIYVPNIQRYGSGSLNESYPYERYGYDLQIAYLGRYIYQDGDANPDNKKYYQNFFAIFNETSVLGFPLFMTKHHFMNCSKNWTDVVEIYGQKMNKIEQANHWDDSYVIVEPYSGVSFQSVIYLQANYFHQPDLLFTYNRTSLLPVFSIFRSGNLTQQKADELFQPLVFALNLKTALFYIGIVSSLGGASAFGFAFTKKKQIQKEISEEKKNQKKMKKSQQKIAHQKAVIEQKEKKLDINLKKNKKKRNEEIEQPLLEAPITQNQANQSEQGQIQVQARQGKKDQQNE